jgi:ATP-binding cassette subfamily F protein uup
MFGLEGDGRVGLYPGGYADWQRQRPQAAPEPAQKNTPPAPRPAAAARNPARLSYKEQRERQELPELIDKLEREIAELHASLCDATLYQKSPDAAESAKARLPLAEAELEAAFARWAEIEQKALGQSV